MSEENALVATETAAVAQWSGAAERAVQNKTERDSMIQNALREGTDYGVIPGTNKPTLFKPGAEKVGDALGLYPKYITEKAIEDFDKPLFFYRVCCELRQRGSNLIISTGVGSCNSMESRYRWRKATRTCPHCGREAIIKGKADYGGGWLCWGKKDGCGAKFDDTDPAITGQETGRVPNPDVCDIFNTILKMAEKRAMVAAVLGLGLSDTFTQDMEDIPRHEVAQVQTVTAEPIEKPAPAAPAGSMNEAASLFEEDAPKARKPAAEQTESCVRGRILDVKRFTFKKKDGEEGERWEIHSEADTKHFGTFSATVADAASTAKSMGSPVDLWWVPSPDGKYMNCTGITPVEIEP